ncbi:MAG: phosphoglucosamine mutase [Planctomycetota bacterium]|nr:MAG: phosphoglucosamine mutase [Planctomycetota bacterium]
MNAQTLFGTDGIRGRAGSYPLVPGLLERLGLVLAARIHIDMPDEAEDRPKVLIGHDGRESGETLVAAVAAGLTKGGIDVDVLGLATTPSVAYLTFAGPYQAGVVVSASHNPAADNGIKLLGRQGAKLAEAVEQELETALLSTEDPREASEVGEVRRTKNLLSDYIAWLRSEAFPDLDLGGKKFLVDCANGAASKLAPRILHAFGAETICINDKPDGLNINDGCGALHPEVAAKAVVEKGCDLGLSLDGDADRGMLIDRKGRILDGDAILAGLGISMQKRGELKDNTVVATVMSNLALERCLQDVGATLLRAQVGDKYVAAAMREGNFNLGGEKSGHILFGDDHGYRGDGIYTLLRVLESLARDGEEPSDFAPGYADLPQRLVNLKVSKRLPLEQLPSLFAACADLERELGDRGRIVVRFSGTELLLRLMVEALEADLVDSSIAKLEAAVKQDDILV